MCGNGPDSEHAGLRRRPPAAPLPEGAAAYSGRVLSLVSVEDIQRAAQRLRGTIRPSPLVPFPFADPPLLLKLESLQPTGPVQVRGAYAAISALPDAARQRGVVAHSSGNHAQAVAYAAGLLGVRAAVVIPENAPELKIAATRRLGAEVVLCPPGLAAREAAARELISAHGYTLIPPFDDPQVIAGQGTAGLEIAIDCPEAELVVVPVSGGGLISGIATAVRSLCPRAAVIGVEPELAADARDSLRRGEPAGWPAEATQRTIADALRVERVAPLTLAHMLRYVDDIVTVSEAELREAVRRLAAEAHLVAEPGGAAAVAACLLQPASLPAAGTRVAVVAGGNIAPAMLAAILAGQPVA